ncbi:MAG: AbrB/MazE/SpoVT family DNA-binding domain-containing protein [Terracidiphilus sp.]|jgi:AbrB family looped-hinge helix DNA binding protein
MATAALTSKGQITVPISIRKKLGLQTGDQVLFIEREDGEILVRAKKGDLMDFYGMFKSSGKPATVEEMDEAVGRYLTEDDARITAAYKRRVQRETE